MGLACCDSSAEGHIDQATPAGHMSRNSDHLKVNANIAAESIKLEYFG